jgi:hypothetical protein
MTFALKSAGDVDIGTPHTSVFDSDPSDAGNPSVAGDLPALLALPSGMIAG